MGGGGGEDKRLAAVLFVVQLPLFGKHLLTFFLPFSLHLFANYNKSNLFIFV